MLDQFSAVRPDRIRVMPASCGWAFRIFVLIYGCVVVTLTCMEFTEMMAFQVTMTIARCRILLLGIVLLSWCSTVVDRLWHSPCTDSC